MRIMLIGSGDLARQIMHYISVYDALSHVVGFVDDFVVKGTEKYGFQCLGEIKDILGLYSSQKFDAIIVGIGYNHFKFRHQLYDKLHKKIPFYTFTHPTSFIDASAIISPGCCVGPNVIIEQRAVIGPNVFLYGGVNVSHDSSVGAHSLIAPSAAIAGFVKIGSRCFIGLHASIIEQICIADDVIVGGGALVSKHLSKAGTYIGVPAYKK